MTNSLLLKMAIEIVSFPSYKMVDLSIVMLNYQRVIYIYMNNQHDISWIILINLIILDKYD